MEGQLTLGVTVRTGVVVRTRQDTIISQQRTLNAKMPDTPGMQACQLGRLRLIAQLCGLSPPDMQL